MTMTIEQARSQAAEMLAIVRDAPRSNKLPDRTPLYPRKHAKRHGMLELRWRHLDHVDSMARDPNFDPERARELFVRKYEYFFRGKLRARRCDELPADAFRKIRDATPSIGD